MFYGILSQEDNTILVNGKIWIFLSYLYVCFQFNSCTKLSFLLVHIVLWFQSVHMNSRKFNTFTIACLLSSIYVLPNGCFYRTKFCWHIFERVHNSVVSNWMASICWIGTQSIFRTESKDIKYPLDSSTFILIPNQYKTFTEKPKLLSS